MLTTELIMTVDSTAAAAVICQDWCVQMAPEPDPRGVVIYRILAQRFVRGADGKRVRDDDGEYKTRAATADEYSELHEAIRGRNIQVNAWEFFEQRRRLLDRIFAMRGEKRERRPDRVSAGNTE